jgi:pyrroloquinoline quinone biosynthesis protein E
LDHLAPHTHRLKLTGGEPTLHPQFDAIVSHIQELGTSFTVFTNGCWPDPQSVLNSLKGTPNLVGVLVSLHGATATSHQAFSQTPGSYDETVTNIGRAVETGIPVTLSTVLHRATLHELTDVVSLALSLGAGHVVFNRFFGHPDAELAITNAQLEQAVHAIDAMRDEGQPVSHSTCIPQCFTPSSSTGCLAGVASCTVDPWGNLRPCNNSPMICGSLPRGTMEEAWNSPEMERFRQAIPQACHTCAAFSTCHAGCRALAMELNLPNDPLMTGPLSEFGPPSPVRMGRNWRPLQRFEVRHESFGLVLLRGDAVLAVRREAAPLFKYLDGTHTLAELEQVLAPAEMSLVGELFRQNLVEMTE